MDDNFNTAIFQGILGGVREYLTENKFPCEFKNVIHLPLDKSEEIKYQPLSTNPALLVKKLEIKDRFEIAVLDSDLIILDRYILRITWKCELNNPECLLKLLEFLMMEAWGAALSESKLFCI